MVKRTNQAALEDGEVAFYGVGVHLAVDALACAVFGRAVRCVLLTDARINAGVVCHQIGLFGDVLAHNLFKRLGVDHLNVECADFAFALDEREDFFLGRAAAQIGIQLADFGALVVAPIGTVPPPEPSRPSGLVVMASRMR